MGRALFVLVVASGVSMAGVASGSDAAAPPGSLERASLSAIPAASPNAYAPAKSVKPPARIPAKETAAGIRVDAQTSPAPQLRITSEPDAAGATACLGLNVAMWPLFDDVQLSPQNPVTFVRVERLIEQNGNAILTLEDVFIDPRTRGARSLGITSTALKPVAAFAADAGERVYAYRDDASVHLVWRTTKQVRWHDARGASASANCGHGHLVLDAKDTNGPKSSVLAMSSSSVTGWSGKPALRQYRLTASLSKSSHDSEPILSVAVADSREPGDAQAFLGGVMSSNGNLMPVP